MTKAKRLFHIIRLLTKQNSCLRWLIQSGRRWCSFQQENARLKIWHFDESPSIPSEPTLSQCHIGTVGQMTRGASGL